MKKLLKRITHTILLSIFFISLNACNSMDKTNYGEKTVYFESETKLGIDFTQKVFVVLQFPDFNLIYLDQREEGSLPYAPDEGFVYEDFEISDGKDQKIVSWSSGTGDIGPAPFEFNGKEFLLEKDRSDIFGELGYNEIVVWEREDYEKNLSEKRMN